LLGYHFYSKVTTDGMHITSVFQVKTKKRTNSCFSNTDKTHGCYLSSILSVDLMLL